jgi:hypothetical protein
MHGSRRILENYEKGLKSFRITTVEGMMLIKWILKKYASMPSWFMWPRVELNIELL